MEPSRSIIYPGGGDPIWLDSGLAGQLIRAEFFGAPAPSGVTGALVASESGADTLAASGVVVPAGGGAMAAVETGADTAASTGTVLVRGAAAATETGNGTFAGTGLVLIRGGLAATEAGADAVASVGTVAFPPRVGSLAAVESGDDVFSASSGASVPLSCYTLYRRRRRA